MGGRCRSPSTRSTCQAVPGRPRCWDSPARNHRRRPSHARSGQPWLAGLLPAPAVGSVIGRRRRGGRAGAMDRQIRQSITEIGDGRHQPSMKQRMDGLGPREVALLEALSWVGEPPRCQTRHAAAVPGSASTGDSRRRKREDPDRGGQRHPGADRLDGRVARQRGRRAQVHPLVRRTSGCQLRVVAGAGFEPATFGL